MKIIETRFHEKTSKKPARMSASYATVVGKRKGKIHFDIDESLTEQEMSDLAVQKFLDSQEGDHNMVWHRTAKTSHGGWIYVDCTEVVDFAASKKQGVTLEDEIALPEQPQQDIASNHFSF